MAAAQIEPSFAVPLPVIRDPLSEEEELQRALAQKREESPPESGSEEMSEEEEEEEEERPSRSPKQHPKKKHAEKKSPPREKAVAEKPKVKKKEASKVAEKHKEKDVAPDYLLQEKYEKRQAYFMHSSFGAGGGYTLGVLLTSPFGIPWPITGFEGLLLGFPIFSATTFPLRFALFNMGGAAGTGNAWYHCKDLENQVDRRMKAREAAMKRKEKKKTPAKKQKKEKKEKKNPKGQKSERKKEKSRVVRSPADTPPAHWSS